MQKIFYAGAFALTALTAASPAMAAPAAKPAQSAAEAFNVPAGDYVLDKNHANILWSVTHFGQSRYYGRFDGISADLHLDGQDITRSRLIAEVNPASVDTNHQSKPNMFNAEIAGEQFLNAAKFPLIRFESTKLIITGKKTGKVEGRLSLHGVTKPLTLNVHFNKGYKSHPMTKLPTIGFSATASFKRSDFGISQYVPNVSDKVKLIIEAEFYQKQAADKKG